MLQIKTSVNHVKVFFMKSKIFLQLITALFVFFSVLNKAVASPVPEEEAVRWANATGYALIEALGNPDLEQKYIALDKMFQNDVDTVYVARFVIGRYWRTMAPEQQRTYLKLFSRYVLSLYKNYPLDFETAGIDFTITTARINGNYTDIFCNVKLPENMASENLNSVTLEFKVTKNTGKIKIVDLKIGESSLLLTYRTRFYTMIKDADEDMDWFLEDLETLTVSNEKNAEEKLLYR